MQRIEIDFNLRLQKAPLFLHSKDFLHRPAAATEAAGSKTLHSQCALNVRSCALCGCQAELKGEVQATHTHTHTGSPPAQMQLTLGSTFCDVLSTAWRFDQQPQTLSRFRKQIVLGC